MKEDGGRRKRMTLEAEAARANGDSTEDLRTFNCGYKLYKNVAKAMLQMLEYWPPTKELFGDLARGPRPPPAPPRAFAPIRQCGMVASGGA